MRTFILLALLSPLFATSALSQHPMGGHSPYAGYEKRSIKAYSDQEIADLQNGRGIGLALPAELNGYPGPSHVLELAEKLRLSDDQKKQMENLYGAMRTETVALGLQLIDQERELDQLFRLRAVTLASLQHATAAIGQTQAALRNAHLKYHLSTIDVLTPEQIEAYDVLRGYRSR
jgi:Spy/CpxP family protein refolding chaperone